MTISFAETGCSAVSRIDVHPDFVPLADIGNVVEWIERSDGGCTGAGRNRHNRPVFLPQFFQSLIKPIGVDPAENVFPMIPSGAAHNDMLLGAEDKQSDAVSKDGMVLV